MKKTLIIGAATLVGLASAASAQATLEAVKARGQLVCGTNTGLAGFAAPDAQGNWQGFDVDVCKALAAAIFGDATKVEYIPTTSADRFEQLASGKIDVLVRNSTWTYSRDTDLKLNFVGVNYYDGQGFMVRKDMNIASAKELDGATVCIQTGTTTELNLADYFRTNGMTYTPVPVATNAEGEQQFLAGACDVYTTDVSGLAASRAIYPSPDDFMILPEVVSKEPLGPVVRHGDDNWGDIVRWTFNALVTAEELGITSANVEELSKGTQNPEINRLLGTEGTLGAMIGLEPLWAKQAIAAVGNYGEIFARHIGEGTPIGLARGLNAQWTQGGLLYSPPFR
ncbi:MAG: amino acid ABC transporter substrate-binding protein [Rhodobacteraceae bacterium]|jgi:general L-amino acid transport system substrate-binding protein|nr:amino acid ABC transporter substrate-binding protein [Paracoccaceae bacterium]